MGQQTSSDTQNLLKELDRMGLNPQQQLKIYNYRRQIVGDNLSGNIVLLLNDRDWCMHLRTHATIQGQTTTALDFEFIQRNYAKKGADLTDVGQQISTTNLNMVEQPLHNLIKDQIKIYKTGPSTLTLTGDEKTIRNLYNEIVKADMSLHDPTGDPTPYLNPAADTYCESPQPGPLHTEANSDVAALIDQSNDNYAWCMRIEPTSNGQATLTFTYDTMAKARAVQTKLAGLPSNLKVTLGQGPTVVLTGEHNTLKHLFDEVERLDRTRHPQPYLIESSDSYCVETQPEEVAQKLLTYLDDRAWCAQITPPQGDEYGLLVGFGQVKGAGTARNQAYKDLSTAPGFTITRAQPNALFFRGNQANIDKLYQALAVADAQRHDPNANVSAYMNPAPNAQYCHPTSK